jgi:hypothetical protein
MALYFPLLKKFPGWNPWQYLNTFKNEKFNKSLHVLLLLNQG